MGALYWAAEKLFGEVISAWKQHKKVRAALGEAKRRILATRISNNLWTELRRLRDIFLRYGLADKNAANRQFFDKWLTHFVVEMGYAPSGGWTGDKVEALHRDLESVTA